MHFSQDDAAAVFDTIDTNPKNGKITKMPELQEYLDKTNRYRKPSGRRLPLLGIGRRSRQNHNRQAFLGCRPLGRTHQLGWH
jgi:hypothetical protein